eukprot:469970-Prorocentrum_minimum.AAC.1
MYSNRGAATGPTVGYIPIEGLRLVRWWDVFQSRGCDWSGGGMYSNRGAATGRRWGIFQSRGCDWSGGG